MHLDLLGYSLENDEEAFGKTTVPDEVFKNAGFSIPKDPTISVARQDKYIGELKCKIMSILKYYKAHTEAIESYHSVVLAARKCAPGTLLHPILVVPLRSSGRQRNLLKNWPSLQPFPISFFLESVVEDPKQYTEHAKRKTVKSPDVLYISLPYLRFL